MTEVTDPIEIPDDYPEFGEYDGKRVRLREIAKTFARSQMADILVDLPGKGVCRPWRGWDLDLP